MLSVRHHSVSAIKRYTVVATANRCLPIVPHSFNNYIQSSRAHVSIQYINATQKHQLSTTTHTQSIKHNESKQAVIDYDMNFSSYDDAYNRASNNPSEYWYEASKSVYWHTPPSSSSNVLDSSNPPMYKWYPDAELNTCYNALDLHVEAGHGNRVALIYDSPVTKQCIKYTYQQMLDEVSKLAGAMKSQGLVKGDRVLIYMPMIPQATFAMLACARLGVIHSVVFGGFAGPELAKRIIDAKPKLIFTASCGIEVTRNIPYKPMLDEAIEISKINDMKVVLYQRHQHPAPLQQNRDYDWNEWVKQYGVACDPVPVKATDLLYILYTSGSTGTPKGVVRDNGGHAVALKWCMRYIYNAQPGDVFWSASDIGWVVGHSFIVYGPLMYGCTTILYEGKPIGTPDAGAYWRVISQHGVKRMFTAPTAIRAIKKEDPEGELVKKYDLSKFEGLYLAGERADPDTVQWVNDELNVPIIDNWWQTETGFPIVANPAGIQLLPIKFGSATKPLPGYNVQILDDNGNQITEPSINGNIAIKLPLPPGTLPTLWQNQQRFLDSYMNKYPGYYDTSDAGYIDSDGYIWIMSRTDDVLNVAGHRLSSGGIEEVLAHHPAVAEAAVIGVADKIKGEIPVGFVVLKGGHSGIIESEAALEKQLVANVRKTVGAVAAMKRVLVVKRLPKTRSGKILRNLMRAIADRKKYTVTPTIEDIAVVDEITDVIERGGIQPNMEGDSQVKAKVEAAIKKAQQTGKTTN